MSCQWTKIEKSKPINLENIMFEERTNNLRSEKNNDVHLENQLGFKKFLYKIETEPGIPVDVFPSTACNNTRADTDVENYAEEEINTNKLDRFDIIENIYCSVSPQCGFKVQKDGKMIIIDDVIMTKRKNPRKLHFPTEFRIGKDTSVTMHLKHVDQKLLDPKSIIGIYSRKILYKMISDQLLQRNFSLISVSKKSTILMAESSSAISSPSEQLPKICIVKIFKSSAKLSAREGAETEMNNLIKLRSLDIPCPEVVLVRDHILVVSFIGEDGKPAPNLVDIEHKEDIDFIAMYNQVIKAVKTLYQTQQFVFGNLSKYNILWHKKQCYFIEVGQLLEAAEDKKNAFGPLYQDCKNVIDYFSGKHIPEIITARQLWSSISGGCKCYSCKYFFLSLSADWL